MDSKKALKLLSLTCLPSSVDILKSAFRTAIKKAHPDTGGTDKQARLVIEAYAFLEKLLVPDIKTDTRTILWGDYMRSKLKNVITMKAWMSSR